MQSSELDALIDLSARVGADPALVQGAGGNTSLKDGDTLWIKASGLWLMNARAGNMLVPVRLSTLLAAVAEDHPSAEKAQEHVIADLNPSGLRPSIETTVHGLLPQKVVVHVHCVETIAIAVRADAEAVLAERLAGVPYAFVPYARPGLPLARAIAARVKSDTTVLILGNHGLAVAADTVADAEALLRDISARLRQERRAAPSPDLDALSRLAVDSNFRLPDDEALHGVATDLASCRIAASGSLYPDHVIFLGKGVVIAGPGETAAAVAARLETELQPPTPLILFPGKGVLVARDISAGAAAMARCLVDVTSRIPESARLRIFTDAENGELLNWDAEKYRQQLNAAKTASVQ